MWLTQEFTSHSTYIFYASQWVYLFLKLSEVQAQSYNQFIVCMITAKAGQESAVEPWGSNQMLQPVMACAISKYLVTTNNTVKGTGTFLPCYLKREESARSSTFSFLSLLIHSWLHLMTCIFFPICKAHTLMFHFMDCHKKFWNKWKQLI